MRKRIALAAALVTWPVSGFAQEKPAPAQASSGQTQAAAPQEDRVKALEEQLRALADQVAQLQNDLKAMREAQAAAPTEAVAAPAAPAPAVMAVAPQATVAPQLGGAQQNAKLLNPDISMIGDFIGTMGRNTVQPSRALELHESEVGLQAIIDPYARADVFISFGEEGVNVEEGYVTFTSLPAELRLRVGKMRAEFGKVNAIHNHAMAYIDRPLATNNLVGGEDGIDDAGMSLTRILPAPKNWFLEGTAQVFRGDSSDVFQSSRRQDVSVVGHLRAYKDLGESTNLDLGISYARGHNDQEAALLKTSGIVGHNQFLTNLYGADATLRWKPLRRAIYKSFLWRTELFWSARDQLSAPTGGFFETQHGFGMYSSAEYRVNRRWTVGGRFDRSGHAANAALTDNGFSAILTYWPSEFSQIRGQYRFGRLANPASAGLSDANELLFQFLFVMGAHGAHPF